MTGNEIRTRFLEFFKSKGHTIKSSASLVPDDPTILFSIAGMVQFKKIFLGEIPLEYTKAASSQKCIRTNDLDNVGRTARHHTFFEMLGNFSFGDYFKKEAINWGWEFLTSELKLPKEKLHITIYKNDDEAFDIWHKEIGIPQDRIYRMGDDTNFWTMGDTGPCGPCSEILIDLGPEFGCGKPDCKVGCDCDRYLELWNLVFTQYDRSLDGKLTPLPRKNIDTGMGLERLTSVIQQKRNNFETDLMFPIIEKITEIIGVKYGSAHQTDVYLKIIADHIRAITFLIADGVMPSNEERGYVLRKLIRRSIAHGNLLGYQKPFLSELFNTVIKIMKLGYPEIEERKDYINNIIISEEENFIKTLERAYNTFKEIVDKCKNTNSKIISGEDAFLLSDTYGLPISITETLAENFNLTIDYPAYEKLLEIQQKRSQENWHEKDHVDQRFLINTKLPKTIFKGYDELNISSKIIYLVQDNVPLSTISEKNANILLISKETPFYAESGGQSCDVGIIKNGDVNKIIVENTTKQDNYFIHSGKLICGKFSIGDYVNLIVNENERKNIARNHSATHLLQAGLRKVLGLHINQAGSLVTPKYLRFDFTHPQALTSREIECIEEIINSNILQNFAVDITEKSLKQAKLEGATALFGEKYGDTVRMVKIGEISKELCGGTHVKNIGEIGLFKITKEESVSSGVRRIEAITSFETLNYLNKQIFILDELCEITKSTPDILKTKITKIIENIKILEKEKDELKTKLASGKVQEFKTEEINGVKIIHNILPEMTADNLRNTIDDLKNKIPNGVFILGSVLDNKAILVLGITKNLTSKIHAGEIVKESAKILGGNGGGRPDLAQAGGTKFEKLTEAIIFTVEMVKGKL